MNEGRTVVSTSAAPAAIGPYSQAIVAGNLVFCSGQIPLSPETGQIVGAGDIAAQTEQVMKNLLAILEASGATASTVIKTTCFLKNMEDFAAFNAVYAKYLGEAAPARSCVEVARLPKDVLVEVEAIAYVAK